MRALEQLWRRIARSFGLGYVTAPPIETGTIQKLQIGLPGGEIRDGIPSMQLFGFASSPEVGADALAIFINGDRSNGLVIGTNDQRYRPTGMKPGEVMFYDAFGKSIYLSQTGIVINANGQNVTLNNAPMTTLNTNLAVVGSITATQNITAGQGGADQVTLQGHKHPTAATGSPSSPTPGT